MKRRPAPGQKVQRYQRRPTVPQGGGLLRVLAILLPASAVVSVGVALMLVLDLQPGSGRQRTGAMTPVAAENPAISLPEYVLSGPPETQEAYRFALEEPDALEYIPCYCGCGGQAGHESLRECFLKETAPNIVEFDQHGSGCGVCVNIALDVKAQMAQGKSLSQIRAYVDSEYGSIGPGTDTPLPSE